MQVNHWPAGQGSKWLKEAFTLFKQKPFFWIVTVFGITLGPFLLGRLIPFFGAIFADFLQTLLGIGFLRVCKHMKQNHEFRASLLWADLQKSDLCMSILWLKGLTYLSMVGVIVVIGVVDLALGVTQKDIMSLVQIINSQTLYLIPDSFYLIIFINIGLLVTLGMLIGTALIFAAPLIAFKKTTIAEALKLSLIANFKNIGPFTALFGMIIGLSILCLFTLGFGFIALIPTMMIAMFVAFEDLFGVIDA
jgi:hypothetical protein